MTVSKNESPHKIALPLCRVLRFIYYYAEGHYAEGHYAECHYAECHYAECHYAECHFTVTFYLLLCLMPPCCESVR